MNSTNHSERADAAKVDRSQPSQSRLAQLGLTGWLATGAWLGLSPVAPGTVGAVWGVPLAYSISLIPGHWLQALLIVVLCAVGIPICGITANRLGRKDPGAVVWDEIASLPITYFLVPTVQMGDWRVLIAGFVLHRVFDISKPPPARQLEHLPGGLGIMADDWSAGVYSCLVLHGLLWVGVLPGGAG